MNDSVPGLKRPEKIGAHKYCSAIDNIQNSCNCMSMDHPGGTSELEAYLDAHAPADLVDITERNMQSAGRTLEQYAEYAAGRVQGTQLMAQVLRVAKSRGYDFTPGTIHYQWAARLMVQSLEQAAEDGSARAEIHMGSHDPDEYASGWRMYLLAASRRQIARRIQATLPPIESA